MSDDKKSGGNFFSDTTRRIDGGAEKTRRLSKKIADTVEVSHDVPARQTSADQGDEKTRLFSPAARSGSTAGADTNNHGYVVGWVVILRGPGQGASFPIGYGVNPIGRNKTERIRIDFGDEEISRSSHCAIIFDDRNSKFYIKHGESQNLTYLNDNPVLAPTELEANAEIMIGKTTLLFAPLCGPAFKWSRYTDDENTE